MKIVTFISIHKPLFFLSLFELHFHSFQIQVSHVVDGLKDLLPLVHEANSIAESLGKVSFILAM